MAVEIALVLVFVSLLGLCISVLVWDIQRRRLSLSVEQQAVADLKLRVAELEEENRRLRQEISFLEKMGQKPHRAT